MAIGAVGASSATSVNLQANGIGLQDFLKILSTQLTYQDPLKPMDNQQFLAQLAQFTSLGQTQQVNDKVTQLLSDQSINQSIGLLGKTVDISLDSGTVASGTVTALSMSNSAPQLAIRTTTGQDLAGISLSQIMGVR